MDKVENQFDVTFESVGPPSIPKTLIILEGVSASTLKILKDPNPQRIEPESKPDEFDENGKLLPKTLKAGRTPMNIDIESGGTQYKGGGDGLILGPQNKLYRLVEAKKIS